ncbi:unnamed protein product [Closterium sp. NIES-53]
MAPLPHARLDSKQQVAPVRPPHQVLRGHAEGEARAPEEAQRGEGQAEGYEGRGGGGVAAGAAGAAGVGGAGGAGNAGGAGAAGVGAGGAGNACSRGSELAVASTAVASVHAISHQLPSPSSLKPTLFPSTPSSIPSPSPSPCPVP